MIRLFTGKLTRNGRDVECVGAMEDSPTGPIGGLITCRSFTISGGFLDFRLDWLPLTGALPGRADEWETNFIQVGVIRPSGSGDVYSFEFGVLGLVEP